MSSAQRLEHKQSAKEDRQRRRWKSLNDWVRSRAAGILMPIVRALGQMGRLEIEARRTEQEVVVEV